MPALGHLILDFDVFAILLHSAAPKSIYLHVVLLFCPQDAPGPPPEMATSYKCSWEIIVLFSALVLWVYLTLLCLPGLLSVWGARCSTRTEATLASFELKQGFFLSLRKEESKALYYVRPRTQFQQGEKGPPWRHVTYL